MRKKRFARVARLVREVAEFLGPVLTVIKLLIEFASKAANCYDRELQVQISKAR
jgi:hypothetical protein